MRYIVKVDIIDDETLKSVCSSEYESFMNLAEENDLDLEDCDVMESIIYDKWDELNIDNFDVLKNAYNTLTTKFNELTGLNLELNFNDQDKSTTYDEIKGSFWAVYNTYQETPELKAFKSKFGNNSIKEKYYTT